MGSYGSLCTEFYDLDKPQAPPMALAYYCDRAAKANGRVLEPMCGSGRFLVPMLKAGLCLDGTDSSAHMIAACRRRLELAGLSCDLFEQPLEQLALPRLYSLAFISSGSIGLVRSDDSLRAALLRLRAHLAPGAPLLMEFSERREAEEPSSDLESRTAHCANGAIITYTSRAIRLRAENATLFAGTYVKSIGDRVVGTEEEELVVRHHDVDTLCSLVRDCGYTQAACYRPEDLAFLTKSGCLLLEAS